MSIKITIECDLCGEYYVTNDSKAHAARAHTRDWGWASRGNVDVCRDCVEKHGSASTALNLARKVKDEKA